MRYDVYEYVHVAGQKTALRAVVHVDSCRACNDGQGHPRNAGVRHGLWKWHGPFETVEAACEAARQISGKELPCGHCRPFVVTT
jgi:hypothetical protein